MLSRLIENEIFINKGSGSASMVSWWLTQCRVPETLARLCADHPGPVHRGAARRPLLREAVKNNLKKLSTLLKKEEAAERAKDLSYWQPLKKNWKPSVFPASVYGLPIRDELELSGAGGQVFNLDFYLYFPETSKVKT